MELKQGAVNQIPGGTVLFSENEPVRYVCAIIKGRITAKNESFKIPMGSGSFVGVCDSYVGRYLTEYVAEEDSMLYAFPVTGREELRTMLVTNDKDYRGLMVNALAKFFFELLKINKEYHAAAEELYQHLSEGHLRYKSFSGSSGIPALSQIRRFETMSALSKKKYSYYEELAKVPAAVQKSFFSCGLEISLFHMEELSSYVAELMLDTMEVCSYLEEHFPLLYNDGEQNLLFQTIRLTYGMEKTGKAPQELFSMVDELLESFNRLESILYAHMGNPPMIRRERLEKLYYALLSKTDLTGSDSTVTTEDDEKLYRELKNSLKQILSFAGLDPDKTKEFTEAMNQFAESRDRMSTEDEGRLLRRRISDGFYKVYPAVFLQARKEETLPKAVELFLNFGFADERLLTKEQVLQLCRIRLQTNETYSCNIYTIPEWLELVYTGKREPSKNEFDMEYSEMLRERKKLREITPEQEVKLQKDVTKKLEYEITNMFRYNHRIVNGQPSTFVPVLCSEQFLTSPERAALTKERMGQVIAKYRNIDYSVFYRELTYADAEAHIEKEYEMKEVVPDIILFPACGQNATMWQEISCKRRDSAGRFLFPALVEGSLDDLVVRTMGRFRWELCRTMQGTAWNNIQYKSLTSEYADYIQFYRKNKELSEERKEKIKAQIVKGKNNTREIFLIDYELWIKAESAGALRLNKVVREILAMYCPFNREIRNALASQPAFTEAVQRFQREMTKKVRELELRYHALAKQGIELTQPLKDTLSFYRDR